MIFTYVMCVNSSSYSKLSHYARPLFGKKHLGAQQEFKAMEKACIISCSCSFPWVASLHMVKKIVIDEWHPCGDYQTLNFKTIVNSYVIPNLHSLNLQLKGKHIFCALTLSKATIKCQSTRSAGINQRLLLLLGLFS